MTFSAVLRDLRARFDCGEFFLAPGDSLRDVVRRAGVPREFGVYVVHAMLGRKRELVYIGKAGTILQNGAIAAQTLPERLTNRQNGMSRARFFSERIAQEGIDRLHFEWFVTFWRNGGPGVPPFLIEAELLAAYFKKSPGRLPRWNKSA